MKHIKVVAFALVIFGLTSCSTREAVYNTAAHVINKECESASNCSGGIHDTYQEREKSQEEYRKRRAQEEENERLLKVQKELEAKE